MPGVFERLGSFGKKILEAIQRVGGGGEDVFDAVDPLDLDLDSTTVVREWGHVRTSSQRETAVSSVNLDQQIPRDLHLDRDPPFNRPFAYTVRMFGRDQQGRFASKEYNLTFSDRPTSGQILEVAAGRFGVGGEYSEVAEVFDIAVVGAYTRPGEFL